MQLNLGEITQVEAEAAYQAQLGLTKDETKNLFFHVLDHLDLIDGTETIARRLKQAGYRLFSLTDNVHEIVAHLKARYQFWNLLEGYVVSAEIGLMKPHQDIFRHAIKMFGVIPSESIFLDDVQANVNGAQSIGMKACRFTSPSRCEQDLRALGLSF